MQHGDDTSSEERRPLSTDDLAAPRADSSAAGAGEYDAERADYDAERADDVQGQAVPRQDADQRPTEQLLGDDRDESPGELPRTQAQQPEEHRLTDHKASAPPLLPAGETDKFRIRWHELQAVFVDDPPEAVRAADQLVAEVMQAVAASFGDHKHELESQWQRGEEVSTEDLRLSLRQYRSFFTRLLST